MGMKTEQRRYRRQRRQHQQRRQKGRASWTTAACPPTVTPRTTPLLIDFHPMQAGTCMACAVGVVCFWYLEALRPPRCCERACASGACASF